MATELVTSQTFQERMFAKIRDQMGDLMTDEDLKALVATAMQKAFFEPRFATRNYDKVELPPYFVELIEKQMREEVTKMASQWMADHPEIVATAIQDCIQKGIVGMVMAYIDSKTTGPLWELADKLRSKGLV